MTRCSPSAPTGEHSCPAPDGAAPAPYMDGSSSAHTLRDSHLLQWQPLGRVGEGWIRELSCSLLRANGPGLGNLLLQCSLLLGTPSKIALAQPSPAQAECGVIIRGVWGLVLSCCPRHSTGCCAFRTKPSPWQEKKQTQLFCLFIREFNEGTIYLSVGIKELGMGCWGTWD